MRPDGAADRGTARLAAEIRACGSVVALLQPALMSDIRGCTAFPGWPGVVMAHAQARAQAKTPEETREPVKKTPADHVTDTLAQLKEMRHYSKTNVEHLTALWILFDGELSKLERTDKIEDLMNRQGQLHDALEAVIADLEGELPKLQPPPPEA
jgi:hypothetical protein